MAKKLSSKNKVKAWDAFSKYVRLRDCLATTGFPFVGRCITCGRKFHLRYLQAGHFLPGRKNSVLFSERGVNAQCRECNEIKHGDSKTYEKVMIATFGSKFVEQMKIDAKKVKRNVEMDFAAIKEKYEDKYKTLMREHGYKTWSEVLRG